MEITNESNSLSPSSLLAKRFSQSIAFSPTSDELSSYPNRQSFLPNQLSPVFHSPTTNIVLNSTSNSNGCELFHDHDHRHQEHRQQEQEQEQRRDQQTSLSTSSNNTSTSASRIGTHVLCR